MIRFAADLFFILLADCAQHQRNRGVATTFREALCPRSIPGTCEKQRGQHALGPVGVAASTLVAHCACTTDSTYRFVAAVRGYGRFAGV